MTGGKSLFFAPIAGIGHFPRDCFTPVDFGKANSRIRYTSSPQRIPIR
jgi:hypothetical protein